MLQKGGVEVSVHIWGELTCSAQGFCAPHGNFAGETQGKYEQGGVEGAALHKILQPQCR